MTNKPRRGSRHITLKPEALLIYDQWKADGEANKVSEAIVKHDRDTGAGLEARLEDIEKRLERLEKEKKG
jgi:hypothetical protein